MTSTDPAEGLDQLRELDATNVEIGKRCGVSPATVSYWRSGAKTPSERSRRALEQHYGIPPDAWGAPARRSGRAADLASVRYRELVDALAARHGRAPGWIPKVARELGLSDVHVKYILRGHSKVTRRVLERAVVLLGLRWSYFTDPAATLDVDALGGATSAGSGLPVFAAGRPDRVSRREIAAHLRALADAIDPTGAS